MLLMKRNSTLKVAGFLAEAQLFFKFDVFQNLNLRFMEGLETHENYAKIVFRRPCTSLIYEPQELSSTASIVVWEVRKV